METPATDYSKLSTKELYELTAKAEGYESVPVDIDTFLNDPHYLGQTYDEGKAVYPYWRDALHQVFPNPLYSPYEEVCLSVDTVVKLSGSPDMTMGEIYRKYRGKEFEVFAYNTLTKVWEPAVAHSPAVTGFKPVYKIVLDNGKWVKATAEHPFLDAAGEWRRTDLLAVGDALMGTLYDEAIKTIVSIELLPAETVYNFTVDRLHNFPLACGIVSHNCVTGCIGAGKALSINELVICKVGKKKAKHVTLEDEILGTDGNYYPVLGIFPQGIKHTYALYVQLETARASASGKAPYDRVITSDDHIWTVYEGGRKYDTTTKEIVRGLNEDKVYSLPVMKGAPGRYFCGWADTGEHECVCFKVGSPDHLFAVGNYTFTHNTSFAIMGALYDLYHVTLLREPQRKYKLLRTTRIIFSLVTATKDLASAVMANQMLDVIAASPYFCSKFMPKKGEKLDEDMFPHHVGVGFGSRGGHNLGKAVIGAIIDEANFQEAVANQAVKNYETITRRMASRFMLKNGSLPCRRWLVSSRNSDSSFLESHIEAVKDNPKVLVLAPAIWDVQSAKGIYSGKTFPVFIGTNTQQPLICTTEKEVEEHAGYIIEVPDIYRDQFEENLPGALMDLAGVASRSSMALIYNVEKWISCQCLDNAISKDEITLSLDGVDKIMDYIVKDLPKYSYYVHLDGALKGDRFGFAMSAIEKQMTVSGRNLLTGEQTLRLSPSLITPIAFGIKARPGSEVPLWKVRQFLLDLRNKGVTIMQVSSDGFQSADMRQMLEKMGFNVKYVSVDTTKDPYLKFASNVNHGLMKVPKSPILDFEVRHLENRDKKIDHPDKVMVNGRYVKGSKDIADAVAASQHEALLASMSLAAGTLIDQIGDVQNMPMRSRQEYVQDLIFGMAQGDPNKHIAGGLY